MDRSSFNFVGSTNDLEKRLAFKEKLASKIEPPKPKEEPVVVSSFNGVSPGGRLVHPSLGEGTLVSVDVENNEVLIDFGDKGLIGLVLSQAKSFVHSPIKPVTKEIDDPFLGSEILRDKPQRPDIAYRQADLSRITSVDFQTPVPEFISVGSTVWHPSLGSCTVLSVDTKTNNIVLDNGKGPLDMVLSQVRSKLRQIDSSPEHVPMQSLIREPLGKQVPSYKSRGDVSVSLPEVFKSWRRNQQFIYLTRNQKLTSEQANDVFAVMDGKKPMFHAVTIGWQTQEEVEKNIIPAPSSVSEFVETAHKFTEWGDKRFWHPDFGECFVSSVNVDENELILNTTVGLMPFVLDVTLPKLAIIEPTSKPEHFPKRLGRRMMVTTEPNEKPRNRVAVVLPEAFSLWKTSDQYIFLTKTILLAPEQANDVIALTAGKPVHGTTEYEIAWE